MLGNDMFRQFCGAGMAQNGAAQQLKRYSETVARRERMGLSTDGVDSESFAAKLRKADEFVKAGKPYDGPTDSIGIILQGMAEPEAGGVVTKDVFHNGVLVSVSKDAVRGNTIKIGACNPNGDLISVNTSVGVVIFDLNDTTGLMKCLDLFSPEDINAILRKITEVKQARDTMRELDDMQNEPVETAEDAEAVEETEDRSETTEGDEQSA